MVGAGAGAEVRDVTCVVGAGGFSIRGQSKGVFAAMVLLSSRCQMPAGSPRGRSCLISRATQVRSISRVRQRSIEESGSGATATLRDVVVVSRFSWTARFRFQMFKGKRWVRKGPKATAVPRWMRQAPGSLLYHSHVAAVALAPVLAYRPYAGLAKVSKRQRLSLGLTELWWRLHPTSSRAVSTPPPKLSSQRPAPVSSNTEPEVPTDRSRYPQRWLWSMAPSRDGLRICSLLRPQSPRSRASPTPPATRRSPLAPR